jgi:hypothetical protein
MVGELILPFGMLFSSPYAMHVKARRVVFFRAKIDRLKEFDEPKADYELKHRLSHHKLEVSH